MKVNCITACARVATDGLSSKSNGASGSRAGPWAGRVACAFNAQTGFMKLCVFGFQQNIQKFIHIFISYIYIYMFRSFLHRHQPSVLVQQCVRAPLGTPGSVTPCLRAVHWRSPLETTFLLEQTGKYLILSAFGHVNNLECSTIDFTT